MKSVENVIFSFKFNLKKECQLKILKRYKIFILHRSLTCKFQPLQQVQASLLSIQSLIWGSDWSSSVLLSTGTTVFFFVGCLPFFFHFLLSLPKFLHPLFFFLSEVLYGAFIHAEIQGIDRSLMLLSTSKSSCLRKWTYHCRRSFVPQRTEKCRWSCRFQ